MHPTRLIFCRTPLQAVLVRAIQEVEPATDTLVYQPTSKSPKHWNYFQSVPANEKIFINWIDDRPSHFLKELRSYAAIPREIRNFRFDQYLVSSFDSLVFSLLTARRHRSIFRTFDDGAMSVLPSEIRIRLEHEPKLHRWIKALVGARNTPKLLKATDRHYTIYDPADLAFGAQKATPIPYPFRFSGTVKLTPLIILLGTPIEVFEGVTTPEMLRQYEAARSALKPDIFIPHPAETAKPYVADHVPDARRIRSSIQSKIAEDVIGSLYESGHSIIVYGFASSALINMRKIAEVKNIIIPAVNEIDCDIFANLGVTNIHIDEILPK